MASSTTRERFNPVTPDLVERLKEAVGAKFVRTDEETLRRFASDETEDLVYLPEVAVLPQDTDAVSAVVLLSVSVAV